MFNKSDVAKIKKEIADIKRNAGYCPDPDSEGCVGSHCVQCAVTELEAVLKRYMLETE